MYILKIYILFLLEPVSIHFGRKLGHLLASLICFFFSKYLSNTGNNTKDRTLDKNKSFLHFLIKRKFGCVLTSDRHISNFSSYNLSDCEKLVLSRGLNFCVPTSSRKIVSVTIFYEFKLLFFQLLKLSLVSQ